MIEVLFKLFVQLESRYESQTIIQLFIRDTLYVLTQAINDDHPIYQNSFLELKNILNYNIPTFPCPHLNPEDGGEVDRGDRDQEGDHKDHVDSAGWEVLIYLLQGVFLVEDFKGS